MAYDKIDWHSGGDYPPDLPEENGGTHIGMFLAWAILNKLEGDLHKSSGLISKVRDRSMTGRQFLESECDCKFTEEDLSEEGNEFASIYYEQNQYLDDYSDVLGGGLPSLYHVEDTWENYDKLSPVIDSRYSRWKEAKKKKWWRFWRT